MAALDYRRHVKRPMGFVVIGLIFLVASAWPLYLVWKHSSQPASTGLAYEYSVQQIVNNDVSYFPSSFYENGPGATNTAYVTELTDKLKLTFKYDYKADENQELTYNYDVKAEVKGKYSLKGSEEDTSKVWSKEFSLVKPVWKTEETNKISLEQEVEVPYADYKKLIDDFRTSLGLPLSSELVVTATVRVSGVVDGTRFDDIRVSTVSAPVDQQLYVLSTKFDKEDKKQVLPKSAKQDISRQDIQYLILTLFLAGLGIASMTYGLRKKIFKTPYQRELDRIYRYHDGIIIRAKREIDLSDKRVVAVKSFDDMLNLEEGLKRPIVAIPAGPEATRFVILLSDVAYEYVLGFVPQKQETSLAQIEKSLDEKLKAKKKPRARKIQ